MAPALTHVPVESIAMLFAYNFDALVFMGMIFVAIIVGGAVGLSAFLVWYILKNHWKDEDEDN